MSVDWKSSLKSVLPQPLRAVARSLFGWRWFHGNYATWTEARAACSGYDDAVIVERVLAATLAVRDGRAAYERDGVLFAQSQPEPELGAIFQRIAAGNGGRLRVLDFGGALGTTYWRHRPELAGVQELAWNIVEQPRFVSVGRAQLSGTPLRFFDSVASAGAAGSHDLLLASTSLQYLETPVAALEAWLAEGFPWILLNNLPLHAAAPDRLAVQRVPPEIYPASYPVWFFNRERFLARLVSRYEVVQEFKSEAVWPMGWRAYPSTGLLLKRRDPR